MLAMWEPLRPQNINNDLETFEDMDVREQEPPAEPWFKSIFNTVLKYKNGLFGSGYTDKKCEKVVQDYAVPVNYKFVLALFGDGFYHPGAIVGKNKKQQEFVIYFYHNKKCCYVKRKHMVLKHGNLLDRKVYFLHCGQKIKAKVFGNNSPANDGFPSTFYLKKKEVWYKVSFKSIFLSKKLVRKCNMDAHKKKCDSICKIKSDIIQSSA